MLLLATFALPMEGSIWYYLVVYIIKKSGSMIRFTTSKQVGSICVVRVEVIASQLASSSRTNIDEEIVIVIEIVMEIDPCSRRPTKRVEGKQRKVNLVHKLH